jgi:hypothetical protein
MRKSRVFPGRRPAPAGATPALGHPRTAQQDTTMDAERINQIGTTLSDLSARTVDLRRYL